MAQNGEPESRWLKHAGDFTKLAEEAMAAGNQVAMIVALQRAAECIKLAKLFGRTIRP